MVDESITVGGYEMDEIDEASRDLLQFLVDAEIPSNLAMIALCRSITILGSEEEIDGACKLIDDLSEIPFMGVEVLEDEYEDVDEYE